jgi:hypothetical protein
VSRWLAVLSAVVVAGCSARRAGREPYASPDFAVEDPAVGCLSDASCPAGQTCALNSLGDGGRLGPTTHIAPGCVARRGTAGPGAACQLDGDCDRGSCQLGLCVELCAEARDCHGAAMSCARLVALLDNRAMPTFGGCLPSRATLELDGGGLIPLPSTAQSFAVYTRLEPFDFANEVGVSGLRDPAGSQIFTPAGSTDAFFNLTIRYQAEQGCSTLLVPSSPKIALATPGVYSYSLGASRAGVISSRLFVKLSDGPIASGSVPLNFYVPDLSGACRSLTLADVQHGALDGTVGQLRRIFAQAGITVGPVSWIDAGGVGNTARVNTAPSGPELPDLGALLQAATAGREQTGLDILLLRSITDARGLPSGVLGMAGGIPSSPVSGTPRTGAAVSLEALCGSSEIMFARTIAHELGHSLGLYHSVEQAGQRDPLGDTATDGDQNLMYWLESAGAHVSPQQGQVMRNDPKVH